jgi:hypothetical protein
MNAGKQKKTDTHLADPHLPLLILSAVVLAALVLASCNKAPTPDTEYYTGVGGLTLEFRTASPPDEIYEDSEAMVGVKIQNTGPIDVPLRGAGAARLSYSLDQFYFDLVKVTPLGSDQVNHPVNLSGKTYFNPGGSRLDYDYLIIKSRRIQGDRQIPTTQVFVNLCYPYQTILDTEFCVDVSSVYPSERPQACTGKPLAFSGQGSPVGITSVETEMLPVGGAIVPQFRLGIENLGGGTLLAPQSESNLLTACAMQGGVSSNWSMVHVQASLLGNPLDCYPQNVRLIDGKGFTRCTMIANTGIPYQGNHLDHLHVELDYVYLQSISKEILIRRVDSPIDNPVIAVCTPQEIPTEIENGKIVCISKCDYCKNNPGASACSLSDRNTRYLETFKWNENYTCGCTRDQCFEKEKVGKCVFDFCRIGNCCS